MKRACTWAAAVGTLIVIAIVLGVRWFGPADLYEKDQPKTMAYTADIILNGRYSLPRDVIYQPATKPPMYNWISAVVVKSTGLWSEWTLKSPSVIGVLATGAIVFAMTRRQLRTSDLSVAVVPLLAVAIWFTFGSNIRHGSVLRLSYLARPDMLLCAFMTGAWACFVVAIEQRTSRHSIKWGMGGWLCVLAAALTKGPAALMPAAFAFIWPLLHPTIEEDGAPSRWKSLTQTWFFLGLPIVALGVASWLALAMKQDAEHVRSVIWGAEVAQRLTESTPEGNQSHVYDSVMWFVTKAQPWGAIALAGLLACALVPRLRRTCGPAAAYLVIVLIGLSLPAGKRMDYLLPAYAPAAVLVALFIADLVAFRIAGVAAAFGFVGLLANELVFAAVQRARPDLKTHFDWAFLAVVLALAVVVLLVERRRKMPIAIFIIIPLALAVTLGRQQMRRSLEAENRWSDHAVKFVKQVRRQVRDDQSLLVLVRGKHPLTTLLHRHPGSYLTPRDLAAAEFVILPQQSDLRADLLSEPLPMSFEKIEERPLSVLGLYRNVPLDRLIAIQKDLGNWTNVENPYHARGTVFRDD